MDPLSFHDGPSSQPFYFIVYNTCSCKTLVPKLFISFLFHSLPAPDIRIPVSCLFAHMFCLQLPLHMHHIPPKISSILGWDDIGLSGPKFRLSALFLDYLFVCLLYYTAGCPRAPLTKPRFYKKKPIPLLNRKRAVGST
jgi:hypothetical protein